MCHTSCIAFGEQNLTSSDILGKRVLEVGSYDINGSLRPHVESLSPSEYIGVDQQAGPRVDLICPAEDLVDHFGEDSFDVVISTEMLEHVLDWKNAISNLKRVCKNGGTILLTARSKGMPFHPSPNDWWRFEMEDMQHIFSDFLVSVIQKDFQSPGVFLKVTKPDEFHEVDLAEYEVYAQEQHS